MKDVNRDSGSGVRGPFKREPENGPRLTVHGSRNPNNVLSDFVAIIRSN